VHTKLISLLFAFILLHTACSDNQSGFSPACIKSVNIPYSIKLGQPVTFEVNYSIDTVTRQFSHFHIRQNDKDIYIKVYTKSAENDPGADMFTQLSNTGSFSPSSTGKYIFHFWHTESSNIEAKVLINP